MRLSNSEILSDRANLHILGGTSNPARGFQQVGGKFPIFMQRGSGAYLYDSDGKTYLDYVLGWGPLIAGHLHPQVAAKLRAQLEEGVGFGTPTQAEIILAEKIKLALPSIERIRFVNSGTEATMAAVELARTYTKRQRIIKFEGCYHGWSKDLLKGSIYRPLDTHTESSISLATFNDLNSVELLFQRYHDSIAGVIIEPVAANMGVIPPLPGFLQGLRELCNLNGSLLIFDEVITGFRIAYGGAQTRYAVLPDITCLGKIIGGGMPIGGYGARLEIMESVAPFGSMYQSGTFSGNPFSATAGIATLNLLEAQNTYPQLENMTASLCEGIESAALEAEIPVCINQVGALFCVFFHEGSVLDYRSAKLSNIELFSKFFWGMLEEGIYLPPSQLEACHLSIVHIEGDIQRTIRMARKVLSSMAHSKT